MTQPDVHHHHYYDAEDKPAVLEHSHSCTSMRHMVPELDKHVLIYWDHEGSDCDEGEGSSDE